MQQCRRRRQRMPMECFLATRIRPVTNIASIYAIKKIKNNHFESAINISLMKKTLIKLKGHLSRWTVLLIYVTLRAQLPEKRVFYLEIFFTFFSALVIAFGCKSYHLSPKMSSFQMYSSELLPICCFWLFLTTFVLFVLE